MAELADALDSGSSDHYDSCRFKSCFPHQSPENIEFSGLFICFGGGGSSQKLSGWVHWIFRDSIKKDGVIGQATWKKIHEGGHIDTRTISALYKYLNCQPGDILEFEEG